MFIVNKLMESILPNNLDEPPKYKENHSIKKKKNMSPFIFLVLNILALLFMFTLKSIDPTH